MRSLINAYKGYYEEEFLEKWTLCEPGFALISANEALEKGAVEKIATDTPKQRLEIYLVWNGIIGYTESIYAIATGEI